MRRWFLAGLLATTLAAPARCQEVPPGEPPELPSWIVGGQFTAVGQHSNIFRSPYSASNSLRSEDITEISQLYTLFMGLRLARGLEVFVNPEWTPGHSLSEGQGVAGNLNSDFLRSSFEGTTPYLGRYFVRWTIGTGPGEEVEERRASDNALGGSRPAHRLVLTAGKFGKNDFFDANRYAASSHLQFLNASFNTNLAWGFPADDRGYTRGAILEWRHPDWAVRYGVAQMPVDANSPKLDGNFPESRGETLELEFHPRLLGEQQNQTVVRLLAFRNVANLGTYREALSLAELQGTRPDVGALGRRGTEKWGFGLNLEQPLADDGETGFFARYGWNDGTTESFTYTECDCSFSFGTQISGANWGRPKDRIGVALAHNLLFAPHREYLKAGGQGFMLGDGTLNYGPERIMEAYYWWQMTEAASWTFDLQYVQNPGYNQDRGPVVVPGLRFHLDF